MLRSASTALVAALAACQSAPPAAPPASLDADTRARYAEALDRLMERDQRHRTALSWGTTDPDELARLEALTDDEHIAEWTRRQAAGVALPDDVVRELEAAQAELDRQNLAELVDWIERCGWPTEERVGPHTDPTAILIHMPMEAVDGVLPLLEAEALAGRMPPAKYASVFDRKRQHDGEPQLYGTCVAFDPATRSTLPPAIVDIGATNAARERIGLPPLEEYRETSAAEAAGG